LKYTVEYPNRRKTLYRTVIRLDSDIRKDMVNSMAREFEIFDLRITVISIEGRSVCGMNVGDYFDLVESSKMVIPDGKYFCIYAINSVIPLLPAKQRMGSLNDWLERDVLVSCPDPEERLVMKIERIKQRIMDSNDLT